ncbi:MAG: alanine racemase [Deltaproteobacteria bacterium]|nr:alanine racemase [Deltaproteobacteria bacterium]MBW2074889.1 alanine racemase [Deltaproteobacteria bacterium]RLB82098.1 MAG: alanine racemase [Deltaproteobacteria bacterium]
MIPNEVIIDLGALRHNFFEIKRLAGPHTRILAVVKSDAYGHGMIPVARTLESAGIDYLGVFELEEGLALRKAGCKVPILIMMGITSNEVSAVVEHGLTPSLFQLDIAEKLSRISAEQGKVTPVHVKVDTGMTRLGVCFKDLRNFLKEILPLKGIELEGLFSHLAIADQPSHPFTDQQIRRFHKVIEESRRLGVSPRVIHISNSGALLGNKGLDLGMARPGILLYGSPPAQGWAASVSFKPVMTFKSRVIQIRTVPLGTSISYGCTYTTPKRCTIATIPVGYDDGYSRLLSNNGEVLIHGRRVPVVGRVCMNLTMVDVTGVEGVSVGDEVVLLGAQGDERITAEEISTRIGTINYEVYCAIGKSNRRVYIDP